MFVTFTFRVEFRSDALNKTHLPIRFDRMFNLTTIEKASVCVITLTLNDSALKSRIVTHKEVKGLTGFIV